MAQKLDLYRNWFAVFLLGTINNLPYVVVNSSAKVLATSFDKDNLVTLVMFANVAFGLVAKGSNTLLSFTKFPFWIRFVINGCLMAIGLLGVAFAPNFWIALVAIVFAGCSATFGENLTLGYLHNYPKELVNAWSSGTGMAGVLGALLYIGLSCIAESTVVKTFGQFSYFDPQSKAYATELKDINRFVFLGTLPIVLVYWISYFVLLKAPPPQHDESEPLLYDKKTKIQEECSINSTETLVLSEGRVHKLLRCFRITFFLSINISLVYFFEYVCRGFAAKSRPKNEYYISELHCPELYASIQLCYQAGVFVSRSSVQLVQIRRVEILTILQFINMIIWILQAWWKFLPVYILPLYMIYVGLLGGASYVNIFYLLRTEKKFPDKDRELCINLTGMWITMGILLGTSFPILLFNTLFQDK